MKFIQSLLIGLLLALPCHAAITHVSTGAGGGAVGTTSLSITPPASRAAGNIELVFICNKYPTNGPSAPTDTASSVYTLLGQASGGSGASGADSGNVYITVYYRILTGTESGNITVAIASGNSATGCAVQYNRSAGDSWGIAIATGADGTLGNDWTITYGSDPGITAGDMCVVGNACNGQTGSEDTTLEALACSGVTFGSMAERFDSFTNLGEDCGLFVSQHPADSGTSNAAPTYSATLSAAVSHAGASACVRLREVTEVSGSANSVLGGTKVFGGVIQ